MFENAEYAAKQAAQNAYQYQNVAPSAAIGGGIATGMASNQACATPQRAITDDLFMNIGQQISEIIALKDRACRVADRISGAIPRDVSKEPQLQQPHTLISKLEIIQTVLGAIERDLSDSLSRIEKAI